MIPFKLHENTKLFLIILLALSIIFASVKVYQDDKNKRALKEDIVELSNIKYGLFSVDEWKQILAQIISKKIEEFDLKETDREKMRKEISTFLYKQINELEKDYYEERSKSLLGFIQSGVAAITGTFGEIKKNIPKFTDEILNFMNKPKNRKAVQEFIKNKLNEYADDTFSEIDYTSHNQIIEKYQLENRQDAITYLSSEIEAQKKQNKPIIIILLVLATLTALFVVLLKDISRLEYIFLCAICFCLLATGLLLPMIEIDARISNMSLSLLGESISFQDQVLYYKSKSILEVVQLMVSQQRSDVLLVGLLVFTFSVLFPTLKLVSLLIYTHSEKLKSNSFIYFMTFRTGKWSMADVMVIAIFMAYIGFTGIITEQLAQIENLSHNIDILTTNKSSLLTGFFTFTAFTILSLLVSHKLQFENKN